MRAPKNEIFRMILKGKIGGKNSQAADQILIPSQRTFGAGLAAHLYNCSSQSRQKSHWQYGSIVLRNDSALECYWGTVVLSQYQVNMYRFFSFELDLWKLSNALCYFAIAMG